MAAFLSHRAPIRVALFLGVATVLAGCSSSPRVKTGSVSVATVSLMRENDMPRTAPILFRVFKEEAVLEVWKQERNGRYGLLRTYPICKYSGALGPKQREGDRQAPEGFYEITTKSLNPWSRNHLAFDTGFPNAVDRALGRTGSHLMVHGGCKSVGCYAMTHDRIEEIYGLAREALLSGQPAVPLQAFPFRMTQENLARHAGDPNMAFWMTLKPGHDMFVQTGRPPQVFACGAQYGFARAGEDPSMACAATSQMAAAQGPDGFGPSPSERAEPSYSDGGVPPEDEAPVDDVPYGR